MRPEASHTSPREEVAPESLKDEVRNLLEEARMVLPGIQALFGFQLIAVFNQKFDELGPPWQYLHLAAMLLIAVSVLLIMTPAAYHRIAEPNQVSRQFTQLATRLIAGAMIPFAAGIALEIMLLVYMVGDEITAALLAGTVAAILFGLAWFAFPLYARRRQRRTRVKAQRTMPLF